MDKPTEPGRPSLNGRSGEYYLRVADCSKVALSKGYLYRLSDGDGRTYSATSKKEYSIGAIVRCIVTIVRTPSGINYNAIITKHQTPPDKKKKELTPEAQKIVSETMLNKKSSRGAQSSGLKDNQDETRRLAPEAVSPVGTLHTYRHIYNSYGQEKKALEIFDKMREYGFHKCGKSFVCSCCGESFDKNQGIKCDTRELYLCNRCRGGQRKKERTSNSLHAISIPMGNKR